MQKLLAALLLSLSINHSDAQTAQKQQNINRMGIQAGNYSGITHVKDGVYAIVDDKDPDNGFILVDITFDLRKGKVKEVKEKEYVKSSERQVPRDSEGICYDSETNTVFIAGESDQKIMEFTMEGIPTGRELMIPDMFGTGNIQPNCGFESLSFCPITRLFWTTTESALKSDMKTNPLTVRLQSFNHELQPNGQYLYNIDAPTRKGNDRMYAHGVSDIAALNDGSLIVMEREAVVKQLYLGSYCIVKLYRVVPEASTTPLVKTLVHEFKTKISLGKINFANYEGICEGPVLEDGTTTLLLINDSQGGQGKSFIHAKDYIKLIKLNQLTR